MFAIGVGKRVDRQELSDIASDPDEDHMFMVDDYSALRSIIELLAARTCQGIYIFRIYMLMVSNERSCELNFHEIIPCYMYTGESYKMGIKIGSFHV